MSSDSSNPWKELRPPVYPEGDYVAVHCHLCGGKNRQDKGWRYRNDPAQRAKEDAALAQMGYNRASMMLMLWRFDVRQGPPTMAHLTYECNFCRKDRIATEPTQDKKLDGQGDSKDEDAVASRTRSRTAKTTTSAKSKA